jgi:hypothetical protein
MERNRLFVALFAILCACVNMYAVPGEAAESTAPVSHSRP